MGGARGAVVQPVETGQQIGAQAVHLRAEAGDAPLAHRLGVNVADDVVASAILPPKEKSPQITQISQIKESA